MQVMQKSPQHKRQAMQRLVHRSHRALAMSPPLKLLATQRLLQRKLQTILISKQVETRHNYEASLTWQPM